MIYVTSEVLSARSVDRPTAVDLVEIAVASGLKFIACSVVSLRPLYSTMKALFLIGAVAKRPRPVRERPIRKALLRATSGMYDDSRPCHHIRAGARLISQPSPPGAHVLSGRLGHRLKARAKLEFAHVAS